MTSFLVTGANSGLGLETTRRLAQSGHRVVMAVRTEARGQEARQALLNELPAAQLDVVPLDLVDPDSISRLAARDLGVDVLVLNAGTGGAEKRLTSAGVLEQFAANHLGHFLLTALTFERLALRTDARVVTVGSGFGRKGVLALDNLDGSRGYFSMRAYMQSKLANTLFMAELDRRVRASGRAVKSVLAHPGVAATEMQQKPKGFEGLISRTVSALFGRPAANGAWPTFEAATAPSVESGDVYGPGKGRTDPPLKEAVWAAMRDVEQGRALWARSEALAGVRFAP